VAQSRQQSAKLPKKSPKKYLYLHRRGVIRLDKKRCLFFLLLSSFFNFFAIWDQIWSCKASLSLPVRFLVRLYLSTLSLFFPYSHNPFLSMSLSLSLSLFLYYTLTYTHTYSITHTHTQTHKHKRTTSILLLLLPFPPIPH